MPRLPPRLLKQACTIDQLLAPLLPVCRDIRSAQNELRWLREHAASTQGRGTTEDTARLLRQYVARRARGEPLQYILGSEYFGGLEIKCKPGVLIPRQETAASVSHLARMLANHMHRSSLKDGIIAPQGLRVLDLCTGTACIPLLFGHELFSTMRSTRTALKKDFLLEVVGVDISHAAVRLAEANNRAHAPHFQQLQQSCGVGYLKSSIDIVQADVLSDRAAGHGSQPVCDSPPLAEALKRVPSQQSQSLRFDIVISNPPYISPAAFKSTTSRSVAKFEPKPALVPPSKTGSEDCDPGDGFYPRLWCLAEQCDANVVLFEVGDMEQAKRVALMGAEKGVWNSIEIWKDDPDAANETGTEIMHGKQITTRGRGHGRSVLACRRAGTTWLDREPKS